MSDRSPIADFLSRRPRGAGSKGGRGRLGDLSRWLMANAREIAEGQSLKGLTWAEVALVATAAGITGDAGGPVTAKGCGVAWGRLIKTGRVRFVAGTVEVQAAAPVAIPVAGLPAVPAAPAKPPVRVESGGVPPSPTSAPSARSKAGRDPLPGAQNASSGKDSLTWPGGRGEATGAPAPTDPAAFDQRSGGSGGATDKYASTPKDRPTSPWE